MIRPGIVSITFRKLAPREIVDLAVRFRLEGIEWGGDVHVPHGETGVARAVGEMTRAARLRVAAYGSYYRAAHSEGEGLSFASVLRTARELGAPLIRIWAGHRGSDDANETYRAAVNEDVRRAADLAGTQGVAVACEYHRGSLTDTPASALQLMREVAHPNARLYWQPAVGLTPKQCRAALGDVQPHLANLHVFQWTADGGKLRRRPLAEGRMAWEGYLRVARDPGAERWALLEFVQDDRPGQLEEDARTLRELLYGCP